MVTILTQTALTLVLLLVVLAPLFFLVQVAFCTATVREPVQSPSLRLQMRQDGQLSSPHPRKHLNVRSMRNSESLQEGSELRPSKPSRIKTLVEFTVTSPTVDLDQAVDSLSMCWHGCPLNTSNPNDMRDLTSKLSNGFPALAQISRTTRAFVDHR